MKKFKAKGKEFIFKNVSGWECIDGYLKFVRQQLKEYVDKGEKDERVKEIMKNNMMLIFKYLDEKMGL